MIMVVRVKYKVDPKEIGCGYCGVVRICHNRETGEYFAKKTIRKTKVRRIQIVREKSIF